MRGKLLQLFFGRTGTGVSIRLRGALLWASLEWARPGNRLLNDVGFYLVLVAVSEQPLKRVLHWNQLIIITKTSYLPLFISLYI